MYDPSFRLKERGLHSRADFQYLDQEVETNSGSLGYTLSGLEPGTVYSFQVVTVTPSGRSEPSPNSFPVTTHPASK